MRLLLNKVTYQHVPINIKTNFLNFGFSIAVPNSQVEGSSNVIPREATTSSQLSQETPGYYSSLPMENTSDTEPTTSRSLQIYSQPIDGSMSSSTSDESIVSGLSLGTNFTGENVSPILGRATTHLHDQGGMTR